MIQILYGVYGKPEGNRVVAKTAADGPFSLSAEQEERLVRLGVAKYIDAPELPPELPEDPAEEESGNTPAFEIPKYSADMKADELREVGKQFELSFRPGMTKAEMVMAIDNAVAERLEAEDTQ